MHTEDYMGMNTCDLRSQFVLLLHRESETTIENRNKFIIKELKQLFLQTAREDKNEVLLHIGGTSWTRLSEKEFEKEWDKIMKTCDFNGISYEYQHGNCVRFSWKKSSDDDICYFCTVL
jgi:hypothetical protein